jgi:hypothetical protein
MEHSSFLSYYVELMHKISPPGGEFEQGDRMGARYSEMSVFTARQYHGIDDQRRTLFRRDSDGFLRR